jgi:hypothetical protein
MAEILSTKHDGLSARKAMDHLHARQSRSLENTNLKRGWLPINQRH